MLLALSLALIPQFTPAAQPLAPYGTPQLPASTPGPQAQQGGRQGTASLEAFETYVVGFGSATNISSNVLDDSTVTGSGQGPGLVLPGCTYSCNGTGLQWNGDTYYGLDTKTFLANSSDGTLSISYLVPQSSVKFNLMAFDGFGDTGNVYAYDLSGNLVGSVTGINLPDSTPVPVLVSASGISSIQIVGAYSWSPIIDDHEYDFAIGFTLEVPPLQSGAMNTVSTSEAIPGTTVIVAYSLTGGGPTATPFGTADLSKPIHQLPAESADLQGETSAMYFVPPGASGITIWLQGLNIRGPGDFAFSNQVTGVIL